MWGGWHYCTLPAPFDVTLCLAVRCSHKEFVPPAQALQSLPQPLQHHDTERALLWLLLDPAAAGDGSPLGLGDEHTHAKTGFTHPKRLPWQNSTAAASSPVFLPSHGFWRQCAFPTCSSSFSGPAFFPCFLLSYGVSLRCSKATSRVHVRGFWSYSA